MTGLFKIYKDAWDQQIFALHARATVFVERYKDLSDNGLKYQEQDYLGYFDLLDQLRPLTAQFVMVWTSPYLDDVRGDEVLSELEALLNKAGFN